jgi:hypothetical protein
VANVTSSGIHHSATQTHRGLRRGNGGLSQFYRFIHARGLLDVIAAIQRPGGLAIVGRVSPLVVTTTIRGVAGGVTGRIAGRLRAGGVAGRRRGLMTGRRRGSGVAGRWRRGGVAGRGVGL